jgi:hypothetical protein
VASRHDNTAKKQLEHEDRGIRSAPLKPIRVVVRELTRPDGKKLKVEVPVYPPFKLEERGGEAPPKPAPRPLRPRKEPKSRAG